MYVKFPYKIKYTSRWKSLANRKEAAREGKGEAVFDPIARVIVGQGLVPKG